MLGRLQSIYKNSYSKIIFVSGINAVISFLLNLSVPLKLGLEPYGNYRYVYTLVGFAGIFHLGYLDGYYLNAFKNNGISKVSIAYVISVVFLCFLIISSILYFTGILPRAPIDVLFLLILLSSLINAINLSNNIDNNFIFPILMQASSSLLLLCALYFDFLNDLIRSNIYLTILIVTAFQLLSLYFFSKKATIQNLLIYNFGSFEAIRSYHSKGIKTLFIGIIVITILGVDKIVLKNHLPDKTYGFYCFSNSFLITLVGLSLSVSNKFISDLFKLNLDELIKKYNLIVKNLIVFSLIILVGALVLNYLVQVLFPFYKNSLQFLEPSFLPFSYIFIILLLHSNFSKVYEFEKHYFIYYAFMVLGQILILNFFFYDIHLMLLITSVFYYLGILIFDYIFLRTKAKIHLSIANKLILATPIGLHFLIHYFIL